jgi:exopolyphosphatase / guanosine-5'-triphosphate,3'-diphosphate pyrophosphatase
MEIQEMLDGRQRTEMKVAVIDVGYNSLKMVKYRIESNGFPKSYGQLGIIARLGEGLQKSGYLQERPVSRTIEAIKLCRETASLESINHVLLIGTSPVREASNREEFLTRVRNETGFDMRVLTGNEEALYGFLGGARSVAAPHVLFFDLGGGSLQLTYAENYRIRRILSVPLGALRLSAMFAGKQGKFSRKDRSRMNRMITRSLPPRGDLGLDTDTVLVGTGGTVRAMARYEQGIGDYPFDKVHNFVMEYDSVLQMSREFFRLKRDELNEVEAIGEGRSDTIAAGAFVVRLLMKRLIFQRMTASTHGLRDGILAEFLDRGFRPTNGITPKEEIESILVRSDPPPQRLGNSELVDCLVKNGVFNQRERHILLTALERGRAEDCRDADASSSFWILMSEDLPMRHEDQLFMAISLVKARRSRAANWLMKRFGNLLLHDDFRSLKKMGTCLRLMEVLDRSSARFKVTYSEGLRISLSESADHFPFELARASAVAFSASIKRPVNITESNKAGGRRGESIEVKT